MKRILAVGLALGIVMLLPATIPEVVHVSYAVPPPPVIQVHQPLVMAPVTPLSEGIGARTMKDISLSTDHASRDVKFLSYWDLMFVLAETSWRPHITSNTFYAEELGMFFHDDYYRDKLYALMMCESSGRPDAIGDLDTGPSYGLFQINVRYWNQLIGTRDVLDPYDNAQIAYEIWKHSDYSFKRWSCDPTGG